MSASKPVDVLFYTLHGPIVFAADNHLYKVGIIPTLFDRHVQTIDGLSRGYNEEVIFADRASGSYRPIWISPIKEEGQGKHFMEMFDNVYTTWQELVGRDTHDNSCYASVLVITLNPGKISTEDVIEGIVYHIRPYRNPEPGTRNTGDASTGDTFLFYGSATSNTITKGIARDIVNAIGPQETTRWMHHLSVASNYRN